MFKKVFKAILLMSLFLLLLLITTSASSEKLVKVTGLQLTNPSAVYLPGEKVKIDLSFSDVIQVDNYTLLKLKLELGLNKNRQALCKGVSGKTIRFEYTIQEGDETIGIKHQRDALELNGASIITVDGRVNTATPAWHEAGAVVSKEIRERVKVVKVEGTAVTGDSVTGTAIKPVLTLGNLKRGEKVTIQMNGEVLTNQVIPDPIPNTSLPTVEWDVPFTNNLVTGNNVVTGTVTTLDGKTIGIEPFTYDYQNTEGPSILFTPSNQTTPVKELDVYVEMLDNSLAGLDIIPGTATYLWTTDSEFVLTEENITDDTVGITAGNQYISSPFGKTGAYYLWVSARDNMGYRTMAKAGPYHLDNTVPTLTEVTMTTNNLPATHAILDKTIIVYITASENITKPTVLIAGQTAEVTPVGPSNTYTASITVDGSTQEGEASLSISYSDVAGNAGTPVTTLTSGTPVIVDRTAPTATITTSTSESGTSFLGDEVIRVTATFSENVRNASPKITISGTETLAAAEMTRTSDTVYYYDYTVVGGSTGTATITISGGQDVAGNVMATTTTTFDTLLTASIFLGYEEMTYGEQIAVVQFSGPPAVEPKINFKQSGTNLGKTYDFSDEAVRMGTGDNRSYRTTMPGDDSTYTCIFNVMNDNNGTYKDGVATVTATIGSTTMAISNFNVVTVKLPKIPDGFYKKIEVGTNTVREGYVITDNPTGGDGGNEFVFIPANGYDNGGFWIGRFEASGEGEVGSYTGKAQSKRETWAWTGVGVNMAAISLYATETSGEVEGRPVTDMEWDLICKFLSEEKGDNLIYTDSRSWSNNSSQGVNSAVVSGSNEQWKAKNIYDLAGNAGEYNYAGLNSSPWGRGGSSRSTSLYVASRSTGSTYQTGFRIALFYKQNTSSIPVPNGYTHIEGDINTGYVIKDDMTGDEFIWIPNSAYEKGGFYIARYEAGLSGTRKGTKAVSKAGAPTSGMNYYEAMIYANRLARGKGDVYSRIPSDAEWQSVLKYILNGYPDDVLTSGTMGNKVWANSVTLGRYSVVYGTANIGDTGDTGYDVKNIYDFFGNLAEWTHDWQKRETGVNVWMRDDNKDTSYRTPAYRGSKAAVSKEETYGFRPVLLFKEEVMAAEPLSIEAIYIASSNKNPAYAKPGDTVTLSFRLNKEIGGTPYVTMNETPISFDKEGLTYTARIVMESGDTDGVIPFTIEATDGATTVNKSATTNGKTVTFDKTLPSVTSVVYSPTGTYTAGTKVTITVNFNKEIEEGTPRIEFSGAASLKANLTKQDAKKYIYVYTIPTKEIVSGVVSVKVASAKDLLGNIINDYTANSFTITSTAESASGIFYQYDEMTFGDQNILLRFATSKTAPNKPVVYITQQGTGMTEVVNFNDSPLPDFAYAVDSSNYMLNYKVKTHGYGGYEDGICTVVAVAGTGGGIEVLRSTFTINTNTLPPLPSGYVERNIPNNTIVNGYVITDQQDGEGGGNEFVWVPATEYKNGGFWAGRYEASGTGTYSTSGNPRYTGEAQSKQGFMPWVWLVTADARKKVAEFKTDDPEVYSRLMTDYEWKRICRFISEEKGEYKVYEDSNTWANTSKTGGVVTATGNNEHWKAKNLYNIGGNVSELTYAGYKSNTFYTGSTAIMTLNLPAAASNSSVSRSDTVGFRIALFYKEEMQSSNLPDLSGTGLHARSITDNDLEHGYVVTDNAAGGAGGNEFVWIPNETYKGGGFFIGRYEGIVSGEGAITKQNQTPSTSNYYITQRGSIGYARQLSGNAKLKGSLLTGKMWQDVLVYLAEGWVGDPSDGSAFNSTKWPASGTGSLSYTVWQDSTSWGNYSAARANTGSNEARKIKNIYDFAGNLAEWTHEIGYGLTVYARGGNFTSLSSGIYPASYRATSLGGKSSYTISGFRVALTYK